MTADSVFGSTYADHYDLFYQQKDYATECDFVGDLVQRFADIPVKSILDLGCGTGGHAIPLAQRGFQVVGVDRSAEMLRIAQSKAHSLDSSLPLTFHQSDLRTLELGRSFDAVIMMFAVLGYQTRNEDLAAALATVRRHLNPGGVFIADFWYGPAVLAQRPGERVAEWEDQGHRVIRLVRSRLDTTSHTVHVRYRLLRLQASQLVAETEEEHVMRFLFPQELAYFAEQANLNLVHLCPFLSQDEAVSETTWNVTVVMRSSE